jgi:FtsZ-interacting cell division protein ZipA
MHTLKKTIPIFLLIFLVTVECIAQNANTTTQEPTTVTLPGGITISTTSLIVGILSVVAVVVVGVVFAARRNNSGHSTTNIFQQSSHIQDVSAQTRTNADDYNNYNVPEQTALEILEIPPDFFAESFRRIKEEEAKEKENSKESEDQSVEVKKVQYRKRER